MKNTTHKSKYFCGHLISEYGLQNGRVDYGTLAKSFDAVLCNNITGLFYSTINNEYVEPEQVNGFIDNSEQIDALQEQIDELEYNQPSITDDADEYIKIQEQIDALQEQIDELESEQNDAPEIFQYYIISDAGAELLKDLTDEILYYIDYLDIYIWGVTHYGTSWDYVLTDIEIELNDEV